ncbi:MAG: hypothetical protein EOO96_02315 [Pedobacter sp.]|nr:MAG: hypothetical protein EOO96_02315 [Pedobacter sp.]
MNYLIILLPGIFVWLCVSATFYILELIPILQNNFNTKALIVLIMIILYSYTATLSYYKNDSKIHGLFLGLTMSLTALILDALITVPYVEIPNGRSYKSFFSSPILWFLVIANSLTAYLVWKIKIKSKI